MFKYALKGKSKNKSVIDQFCQLLLGLGYKPSSGGIEISSGEIGINPGHSTSRIKNGEFVTGTALIERSIEFNIDIREQFDTAIAIAAVREEDDFFKGEHLITGNSITCYPVGTILKIDGIKDGMYNYSINGEKKGSFIKTSAVYEGSRKLTPQEIIAYYNKKEKMKTNQPELIGYEALITIKALNLNQGDLIKLNKEEGYWILNGYEVPSNLVNFDNPTLFKKLFKDQEFDTGTWIYTEKEGVLRIYGYDLSRYLATDDTDTYIIHRNSNVRKATPEGIEQRLIKAAGKKGFVDGTFFSSVRDSHGDDWELGSGRAAYRKETGQVGTGFRYHPDRDLLITYGRGLHVVYEKGIWAKLKENFKEVIIERHSLKMQVYADNIKFKTCSKERVINIKQVSDLYQHVIKINNFKLGSSNIHINETDPILSISDAEFSKHAFSIRDMEKILEAHEQLINRNEQRRIN